MKQKKRQNDCPGCHANPATRDPILGVLPCIDCQKKQNRQSIKNNPYYISLSRKERIEKQQEEYMEDILQPWDIDGKPNKDFVKAYPDLVSDYFSPDELAESDI